MCKIALKSSPNLFDTNNVQEPPGKGYVVKGMEALKEYNYGDWLMIRPVLTLRKRRVIIDVDTQHDFFVADGKMCVRNHRRVLANIRRVMAWARREHTRVISTALVHTSRDPNDTCCPGTYGIRKLRYTLRNRHVIFEPDDCTDLPRENVQDCDQIVLYKRTVDPFEEPRAERILTETRANEFIVIGGPTETALLSTVLGLLLRKKSVIVIYDALGSIDKSAAEVALRKMQAKGAKLVDTRTLFGASHLHLVHACACDRCRGRVPKTAAIQTA